MYLTKKNSNLETFHIELLSVENHSLKKGFKDYQRTYYERHVNGL